MRLTKGIIWKNSETKYVFLLCFYTFVSIIASTSKGGGGLVSQLVAFLFIVFSSCCILKNKYKCKSKIYKTIVVFNALIITRNILFFFYDAPNATSSIRSFFLLLFWTLGFAFALSNFKLFNKESTLKILKILIVETIFYLVYASYLQKTRMMDNEEFISAVGTAGSVYMLVPLILICFRKKTKFLLLVICFIICALSQKRQSLLGFALVLAPIIPDLFKSFFLKYKVMAIIVSTSILLYGSSFFYVLFGGLIKRQEMIEATGRAIDNGREMLRYGALKGFYEASLIEQIFGGGASCAGRYISMYLGINLAPHNAYIDILCAYGIVGLVCYMIFFYALFNFSFFFPKKSVVFRLLFGISSAWILTTFFTHPGNVWLVYFCLFIGCINSFYYTKNTEEIDRIILT